MTSSFALRRFTSAFGTAFAVFYVVALKLNLALFTVYPSLGLVVLGAHRASDVVDPAMGFLAPAMYWYGWAASAACGALVVGLLAALLPEGSSRRIRPGRLWVVPVFAMLACVYLTIPMFRL
jgi:hypothetical protein